MLTLSELVDILQQTQVISPVHLNRLRRLAQASPKEFSPRVALRWLVQQEQLTLRQAERLVIQRDPELAASLGEVAEDDAPIPLDEPPRPANLSTSPQIPVRTPWSNPTEPKQAGQPPLAPAPTPGQSATSGGSKTPAVVPVAEQVIKVDEPPKARGLLDELFDDPKYAKSIEASASPLLQAKPRRKGAGAAWDSPLVLAGGGGLILLIIVGVVLWFVLGRQSGEEVLLAADEDYLNGAYSQAIFKYERFLDSHPSHNRASFARVKRGTAQLRQAVEASKDWPSNLALAERIAQELSPEENFADARPELAALLPTIAESLAHQASTAPTIASLADARRAFDLATRPQYVPEPLRSVSKYQEIEALLQRAERNLAREGKLDQAITAIAKATAAGDFTQGFDLQKALLRDYPDLRTSTKLSEAMAQLSKGLREAVKFEPLDVAASTEEATTPIVRSILPVQYAGNKEPVVDDSGGLVATAVFGTLLVTDASTGRALWRQSVGHDGNFVRVENSPAADLIVFDSALHELRRVDVRTGKTRWRQALANDMDVNPLMVRNKLLLTTSEHTILEVEPTTGKLTGRWTLPQRARLTPTVDVRERVLYLVAEHTNLFVLSLADHRCVEVLPLGHAAGLVGTSPVVNSRFLFVAENRASDQSLLHIIGTNAEGVELKTLESVSFKGQIFTPPVSSGRTLVVATHTGAITAFEVAATDQGPPLRKLVELGADDRRDPMSRYMTLQGSQLLVGSYGLALYEIQVARGRLAGIWSSTTTEPVYAAPMIVDGRYVFLHGNDQRSSLTLEGADANRKLEPWRTTFGEDPLALVTSADNDAAQMLLADGSFVDAASDNQSGLVATRGLDAAEGRIYSDAVSLSKHRYVAVQQLPSGQRQLVSLDFASNPPAVKVVMDGVTAGPVQLGDAIYVGISPGQVERLKLDTLARDIEPFQPPLEAGVTYEWSKPAAAGNGTFVVSDRRTKLYHVGVEPQPKPHLAALREATLLEPAEKLVVAGNSVYAVTESGRLLSFSLPNLQAGQDWDLSGNDEDGPWSIGSRVIAFAGNRELLCFDDKQQIAWRQDWPHGTPTDSPLVDGETLLIATQDGKVLRLKLSDGSVLAQVDLLQSLIRGPMVSGKQLVVVGYDATLLWLDPPKASP